MKSQRVYWIKFFACDSNCVCKFLMISLISKFDLFGNVEVMRFNFTIRSLIGNMFNACCRYRLNKEVIASSFNILSFKIPWKLTILRKSFTPLWNCRSKNWLSLFLWRSGMKMSSLIDSLIFDTIAWKIEFKFFDVTRSDGKSSDNCRRSRTSFNVWLVDNGSQHFSTISVN